MQNELLAELLEDEQHGSKKTTGVKQQLLVLIFISLKQA